MCFYNHFRFGFRIYIPWKTNTFTNDSYVLCVLLQQFRLLFLVVVRYVWFYFVDGDCNSSIFQQFHRNERLYQTTLLTNIEPHFNVGYSVRKVRQVFIQTSLYISGCHKYTVIFQKFVFNFLKYLALPLGFIISRSLNTWNPVLT